MPDNRDKIDSIASPVKGDTMKSIIDHVGADTDSSTLAIHHTLGPKPFQASPGSHIHDGKDSKKIKLSNVIIDVEIGATNGIPAGGTDGQVLTKQGSTDYVAAWEDPGAASYTSTVKHLVKASTAITKGQAVYVSSADGTNMIVSKASNASEATSSKTMGLMADTVAINGHGYVVTEGLLAGLDTSTAAAGDAVWLGVNGALIYGLTNKPSAPAHLVFIGIVTRAQLNNGEIFVAPQNGFELQELHNVSLSSVADQNSLVYDGTAGLWKNKATSFQHTQATSSSSWAIAHNLGFKPNVIIEDVGGATIEGELLYTDNNNLTVSFSQAVAGVAYLS